VFFGVGVVWLVVGVVVWVVWGEEEGDG
jgi:hypothetical protein